MGNGAEVLNGVALLLEGVIRCGRTFQSNGCRVDFKRLLCIGSFNNLTLNDNGGAYIELGNLVEIRQRIIINDLYRFKIGTVGENEKAKLFGVADASYPAADRNVGCVNGISFAEQGSYGCEFHNIISELIIDG